MIPFLDEAFWLRRDQESHQNPLNIMPAPPPNDHVTCFTSRELLHSQAAKLMKMTLSQRTVYLQPLVKACMVAVCKQLHLPVTSMPSHVPRIYD